MEKHLTSNGKRLSLKRPLIMGILNVTSDSFSDGGKYLEPGKALQRALQMVEEGADIIDVGAESTGPGSAGVDEKVEVKRILALLEKLRGMTEAWISIDTYKAEVARVALEKGADMINDVTALRGDSGMAPLLARYKVPVVVMYSKDPTPRTTLKNVKYKDVVKTVADFLRERVSFGVKNGIEKSRFIIDPGMGAFIGSDPKYSLKVLKELPRLKRMGLPLLVGPSRKSFIGKVLDLPTAERLEGSLACVVAAVRGGADIVRVHDVRESRLVAKMTYEIINS